MSGTVDRRGFLKTAAAAVSAAAASDPSSLLAQPTHGQAQDPLFEISLAEWSLHRVLRSGDLDHLDFARAARIDYGIGAVEYVNTFFARTDRTYLEEVKARAAEHGVTSLLIMCDGEGSLGDPDGGKRKQAVVNHHKWVGAAKYLGCHSIRVNARSEGTPEQQRTLAADGLRQLTEFAADREINVIVENHGGLSSNGAWLASVIEAVDHPRCGTLPDFGNFRIGEDEWYDRYQGVAELMPFAKAVSAKSNVFDEEGNERQTDYLRMMRVVLDSGYRGYVGIEYEGSELSEHEGILATRTLLGRVREQLRGEYN